MPSTHAIEVVAHNAELTRANRQDLKEKLLALADVDVILDLSGCHYVDSSGCGVLVSISKHIRERGKQLVLVGLSDDLMTLFELTKIDTLFTMRPTIAAAQAFLAR